MNLYRYILAACLLTVSPLLRAQDGFDQTCTFEQVQAILRAGIREQDLRKQALAWYHWALYEDREYRGNRDSAFQYLARSAERFGRTTDTLAYFRTRAELALRLAQRGLNQEAIAMQYGALAFFRRNGHLELENRLLLDMSRNFMQSGDTAKALEYRRYFRDKNAIVRDTVLELSVLFEEVERLQRNRQYQEAIYLSRRTLGLAQASGSGDAIVRSHYHLGSLYALENDYRSALPFLKAAEAACPANYDNLRRDIYRSLSQNYTALDSLPQALRYARSHAALSDSLLQRDRTAARVQAALQFNAGEKARAIEILEQEKSAAQSKAQEQSLVAAALGVGLLAVLLAMFFIIRDYRHRMHTDRVIARQLEELNQRKIRELQDNLQIQTMRSMLEGQEKERQRIAHDLHDSLGGLLAAARMQIDNLKVRESGPELAKVKTLLDETLAETRHIARNLQPGTLLQFGLVRAVQDLIHRLKGEGSPEITFQQFGLFDDINGGLALNCYRIIQELLQNSLKHAKASEILVQLNRTESELALLVEDDGIGYDVENAVKGMGTDNLYHRVQFLKGELSIQTAPGQGTTTLVSIPVP